MQPVRSVVRKFMLPIALFAGVTWALAFLYMFVALPRHGVGTALLLLFGGAVMSVPWIIMALGVIQRMRGDPGGNKDADDAENGDASSP